MSFTYKLLKHEDGTEQNCILAGKGTVIPKNPDNIDYQAYLAWVAAGNTPTAAD